MVAGQLASRGIEDQRVLEAMGAVPRERFVLEGDRERAYIDSALPIECDQTISQPWIIAAISQGLELEGDERALEVGTGSGYSTAVLARLCAHVISIERFALLAEGAAERLRGLGVDNVEVRIGDGSLGAPDDAPFDAIAVHAAMPGPPEALLAQLGPGGRLVAPVASGFEEILTQYRRQDVAEGEAPAYAETPIAPCRFVPLVGERGYPER
jgi:protein-L-isoaspartate(D-aspartate) O-methyltransferase